MEREIRGKLLLETFGSLQEFCDLAVQNHGPDTLVTANTIEMARQGWAEHLPMALDIAESAVATSVQLAEVAAFAPVWEVTGAEVDVARYLSGEPENMIDFPLTATVQAGRVITLVSSADSNSGSDWLSRGILATALGLALARMGYATEMWADNYGSERWEGPPGISQYQRILVKSTADEIDPARLMYAFGHRTMLTQLAFGNYDAYRKLGSAYLDWYHEFTLSRGCARTRTPELEALYPEGTIFLTGQLTGATPETAKAAVEQELRKLGLLPE